MDNLILTDYIFLFITLVSTLFGFARGFLREIFTILNLVFAAIAAHFLFPIAAEMLQEKLKDATWVNAAAGIGSYVVAWVVIAIINSFVLDALKFLTGGFVDRLLGSALGILRGALIVVGVYLGATITVNAQNDDSKLPAWLKDAKSLNYVKVQSEYAVALMPKEFQDFYKNQNSTISEQLAKKKDGLIDGIATDKLESLGFTPEQINTFQALLANSSENMNLQDFSDFTPDTIKMLGDQAIEDYENKQGNDIFAPADDEAEKPELSEEEIQSLQEQLDSIEVKDAW